MTSLGTTVIDEIPMPIVAIELEAGHIVVHSEIVATHTLVINAQGDGVIFDPDGTLVVSFPASGHEETRVEPGETLHHRQHLEINNGKRGWATLKEQTS